MGYNKTVFYIEQGHLMTPTTFMTYSMAIDPCKTIVVTWTPMQMYSMQQGSQPLISTGITLIYFLLKACRFAFYALSHKTEGRLAVATPSSGKQEHRPIKGEEGHTEVYEQISGDNTEQYGTGTQRPSGSLPVPRRWQNMRLSSCGDVTEYPEEPAF